MLKLLIKLFIKNPDDVRNPDTRKKYGTLAAVYGVFLNIVLFAAKYFAGAVSGSVAISADAFNNLSDAGSSVINLIGFSLSGKKPDADHPFGHGRAEYLAGLAISVMILVMGIELGKTSVEKIITPQTVQFGLLPVFILLLSILVKFYMQSYNKRIGKLISSASMEATAADSLSDCISTSVVLLSMILSYFFNINIDGWTGLVVAVYICYAGLSALKDTISPLLGKAPDKDFVQEVEKTVMCHSEILGIHDLLIHDYGPGRLIISLHAEVDGRKDLFETHDVIDSIESELRQKYSCLATIHLDPIDLGNSAVSALRREISALIKENICSDITIHDLRIVPGPTHTNVIFDAVFPHNFSMSDSDFKDRVDLLIKQTHPSYNTVIEIDQSYV